MVPCLFYRMCEYEVRSMITFYPTLWCGAIRQDSAEKGRIMPERCYMLPASSWARYRRKDGSIRPANLPTRIKGCAVDPGVYVAARKGVYEYDFLQYLEWLLSFNPGQIAWAGMMDHCCVYSRIRQPPPGKAEDMG